MVKAVGKKIQKNYKRVRDTSLWKFMHSRRQSVNGKFRLCPDTGSACYDCFATFPEGMSIDFYSNFVQ